MKQLVIQFMPLAPGESPGDPELGGWRPIRVSTRPKVQPLALEEAVWVVAAQMAEFQLRQAIKMVAYRLAN